MSLRNRHNYTALTQQRSSWAQPRLSQLHPNADFGAASREPRP